MARRRTREVGLDEMPIDVNVGYPELGSQVFKVVFPKDEKVFAIATGYLVFERRGRHLVMLDRPFLQQHPAQRLRRVFRAALVENAGRLILDSLEISSDPDPARGWLWPEGKEPWAETKDDDPYPDGIDGAIMKATRPDAIVALTRRRIVGEQTYLANALLLDAKKPPEHRLFSEWVEREAELRETVERLKTNAPVEQRRRGGRTPYPDDHYREVAMLCVALYADGWRRGFHQEIATRKGRETKTVAHWIRKSRKLGYLAPGEPGRASFRPGPKLLEQGPPIASPASHRIA